MKIAVLISAWALLLQAGLVASEAPSAAVITFRSADAAAGRKAATSLLECLRGKDGLTALPREGAAAKYLSAAGDEGAGRDAAMNHYAALARKYRAKYVIAGEITAGKNPHVRVKIFSSQVRGITRAFEERFSAGEGPGAASCRLASGVAVYLSGRLPVIDGLTAGMGARYDGVPLSWHCTAVGTRFTIYRQVHPRGAWTAVGTTERCSFSDTSAEEGILYNYIVRGMKGKASFAGPSVKGYRKPASPKSLSLKDIFRERNKPKPVPSTEKEREREKRDLVLLKKYYESYFTMNLIYLIGRIYLNRGEIQAFRDFDSYTWVHEKKTLHLHMKSGLYVKFYSDRFYRFVRDMEMYSIPRAELLPRMIRNTIVFCIRRGEVPTRLPDGRTRYVPYFEAGGLGTEYWRDYKGWKSVSLMFASSDPEMKKKINEAEKKGY